MVYYESNYLCHYGLKGMKWGTRRWQYQDGRFNDAGKARYFGQNSSHRPDSVRALQGDPPKSNRSSAASDSSSSRNRSFDKERAKKIAKNVAIGAAIVGGTALVAYGGYKVHQAGGFSTVSKNLKAKMRETKLEDLKLNEEFKAEKASIKAAGKNNLARIRENAKTEFAKIRNEGAFQRHINRLDPEGRVDPNVMKDLARPSFGKDFRSRESTKIIKDRLRNLDSDEIAALNSGKVKLTDLQGRRGRLLDPKENIGKTITEASRHSAAYNKEYDQWLRDFAAGKATRNDRPIADASNLMDNPVTKDWWLNRNKSSGSRSINAVRNKVKSSAQIVSEYKREHPGTKLSSSQIVKNYVGEGAKGSSSSRKTPKLTLTPETFQAGTQFLSEFNKTVQTFKSTNHEQTRKAERGAKAVDDYTNDLVSRSKKSK